MNFDNLFVDTVEDLRRRCHLRASEYDMVQAAGLIRRLTIDKHSLWELVNREHRLVIQYVWNDVAVAHRSGAFISTLWLDPALWEVKADAIVPAELRTELPSAVRTSSIPQFLKAVVVSRELAEVSVHQLVKHYANREGGCTTTRPVLRTPPSSKTSGATGMRPYDLPWSRLGVFSCAH
jgi:hypothetical protein